MDLYQSSDTAWGTYVLVPRGAFGLVGEWPCVVDMQGCLYAVNLYGRNIISFNVLTFFALVSICECENRTTRPSHTQISKYNIRGLSPKRSLRYPFTNCTTLISISVSDSALVFAFPAPTTSHAPSCCTTIRRRLPMTTTLRNKCLKLYTH